MIHGVKVDVKPYGVQNSHVSNNSNNVNQHAFQHDLGMCKPSLASPKRVPSISGNVCIR